MEGIGRARASAQMVMSKLIESRLCEMRPTIGGGDMIERLRPSVFRICGSSVIGKPTPHI